ncbi:hypothetical protein AGOR_G00008290 [Albula goreensis]|uniref:Uncharacterized protein n=1 Tax=Albula goreensis TaxID=1534307 RepID=A0A8T3E5H8_9TELE|nr:hypothetical protein AGOR_G00008290 [Albula goreensis]
MGFKGLNSIPERGQLQLPMSPSAPKAKTEKVRAATVPVPAPPPPPPPDQNGDSVDIVPGRLSESDWMEMVAQEEGEEVVAEILEELMQSVMEKCYDVYLRKQMIPFTVSWARDALVQALAMQFLARDEGDGQDSGLSWEQDSEPQPCGIDSWAQGCVPVIHSRPTPNTTPLQKSAELPVAESDPGCAQTKNEPQSGGNGVLSDPDPIREDDSQNRQVRMGVKVAVLTPGPPPKRGDRRKQPLPHRVPLPAPQAANSPRISRKCLNYPIRKEETCSTSREQTDRVSKFEQTQKNLDPSVMKKLDPAHLPRHQAWPGFEVLESSVSQQPLAKSGGPPTQRQKQDKLHAKQPAALKPLTNPEGSHKARRKSTVDGTLWISSRNGTFKDTGQSHGPVPLSSGLLLDTMVLAPGVTLKDPLRGDNGSYKRYPSQTGHRVDLKPIRTACQLLASPWIS